MPGVRLGRQGVGRFVIGGIAPAPVLLVNPLVAILGPSTTQMNSAYSTGSSTQKVYTKANGPHFWAQAMSARFRLPVWRAAYNSRGYVGYNYGYNSVPIATQDDWIPTIIASPAQIVVWNSGRGSGDVDSPKTVSDYCDPVKTGLLALKAAGKIVVWENLWMRHTSAGGDWASGGWSRQLVLDINAHMLPWCLANGIYHIDVFSAVCDVGPDYNPKTNFVTDDFIHETSTAAYQIALLYDAFYNTVCAPVTPYDPADGLNVFDYYAFPGTGGVATGNGATGTMPDNMTGTRSSASCAKAVAFSIFTGPTGRPWVRATLTGAGTVPAAGEGLSIRPTATTIANRLVIDNWYQARARVSFTDWNGWSSIRLVVEDGAATPIGSCALVAAEAADGDAPIPGFTGTKPMAIRPGEGRTITLITPPFKATNTTMGVHVIATWVNAAISGSAVLETGDWDVRDCGDPALWT